MAHKHVEQIKKAKKLSGIKAADWVKTIAPHHAPGFVFKVTDFGISGKGEVVVYGQTNGKEIPAPVPIGSVEKFKLAA